MKSNEIRSKFLNYFESKGHKIIPSSSLIPHDPTLLFTAAGMVPLKDYFLGKLKPESPNMASSQKCIRTIDIDIIGETDRHLSFFEMLGNFSVGKYFKEDAIKLAYAFIVDELKIDKSKLWFTVYKTDDESFNIWKNIIGVPEERIQRGDADNFWHMNIPGPCGPCSEIFIDRGEKYGEDGGPIGGGEDRFIEIWNLVFMESIQDGPFQVTGTLPSKNIDTGMGLERISMIMQDKETLFDTDLFLPLSKELSKYVDKPNSKYEKVILDHLKSSTFMISDGVVPTNEGRGYILRRLIRRAIRAFNQVSTQEISLSFLIEIIVDIYKEQYPDLKSNIEKILKLFITEENLFKNTLIKGNQEIKNLLIEKNSIDAKDAFKLFETFGFPYELTKEIAFENSINIDDDKYFNYFEEHKKKSKIMNKENNDDYNFDVELNTFIGYDSKNVNSEIIHVETFDKTQIIFTNENPFYYEAGGQISDEGYVKLDNDIYKVIDVIKNSNNSVGLILETNIFEVGQNVELNVDSSFRNGVSKSHTGAHIVHQSLREVLGDHVAQAGSNVTPGKFRFDFSHTSKVSDEELDNIFQLSNIKIFEDLEVNTKVMNIEKAKSEGALAFFGDKYDNDVRVVNIGNFSKELCGGTHVHNSHDVGLIVLLQESSIGSNLRRVEMLSGLLAYEFLNNAYKSYNNVAKLLHVQPDEVYKKLNSQLETFEEYKLKISKFRQLEVNSIIETCKQESESLSNYNIVISQVDAESVNELKDISLELINEHNIDLVVLISSINGKKSLIGATSNKVDYDISVLISNISKTYGGGASKDPNLSIGGGPNLNNIEEALVKIKEVLHNDIK